MAAPKGNKFWMARSSHGRNPTFASPNILWEAANEYFAWVEANPLWETKAFASGGKVVVKELPKMRAMTISGLCIFLDITRQSFLNYKAQKDFFEVATRIEEIISTQKFEGASADMLNSNIIARDLALRDKQDIDLAGKVTLVPQISVNGKSD
jgi:hypothetical protein